jgi:DNA mismatch repair protein PMS2
MGAMIKLGRDGRVLDSSGRVARQVSWSAVAGLDISLVPQHFLITQRGTTVSLVGLFKPLPVRRKEFERNVKREVTKALTLLTGYALVPASATSDGRSGVRLKVESMSGSRGG